MIECDLRESKSGSQFERWLRTSATEEEEEDEKGNCAGLKIAFSFQVQVKDFHDFFFFFRRSGKKKCFNNRRSSSPPLSLSLFFFFFFLVRNSIFSTSLQFPNFFPLFFIFFFFWSSESAGRQIQRLLKEEKRKERGK